MEVKQVTRSEWISLVERIRAAWPRQRLESETAQQWWRRMRFQEYDAVCLALARLVEREKWMPGLADILFEVRRIEVSAMPVVWSCDEPDALGHEGMAELAREYLRRPRGAA